MEESFTKWRTDETDSVVISDSDDDLVETSVKNQIFVVESSDGSQNASRNLTPRQRLSPIARSSLTESAIKRRVQNSLRRYVIDDSYRDNTEDSDNDNNDHSRTRDNDYDYDSFDPSRSSEESDSEEDTSTGKVRASKAGRSGERPKRKDISRDYTREGVKGRRVNPLESSEDDTNTNSFNDKPNISVSDEEMESRNSESATSARHTPEPEIAISLAKQEIGVGNIDPLVAQKRALLVCKVQQLQSQINKTQLLLSSGNMDLLPDKGARLHESLAMQEEELREVQAELEKTPLTQGIKTETHAAPKEEPQYKEEEQILDSSYGKIDSSYFNIKDLPLQQKLPLDSKQLGKKAQATLDKELALTVDRLQDLHGSLVARPTEDQKADDPNGLKVKLMPHQQHALAWLLWREQQRPPGGVLADDMGLGKTLTMISLILASAVKESSESQDDSDDEWADTKPLKHRGGTLVVCPASLLSQWENEINNKCKRGMLSVEVYHGTNRETVPKRLASNDVVITTYNILSREFKTNATVYRIRWKRVILDEAHVIRNHKSQASEAVCGLIANKRWALTGTPIQNKEMDLYSILKFLKCTPFNDLRVWKRWVDNKNAAGRQRLATVMKTLMLRRTKQELQAKGALDVLPDKCIEEVSVKLDPEEQLVYEKILIYSRTLFAQFLAQRAEKDHMVELGIGMYDKPSFSSNPNKETQFTKAQNKLLSLHADVKTHEILVLLLRLRQVCCHPPLIQAMLDQEDMKESGIADSTNLDPNLLSQVGNITLCDEEGEGQANEDDIGIDRRVTADLLTTSNPVFNPKRVSSKMKAVLEVVKEILAKNDKLIIVSQWATMLGVVAEQLSSIKGATHSKFTGSVPIKERQGILDAFNAPNSDPRILLLSLTAGGVGLNLVGANHLLLIDIHWNPQLETQAQDRIYRFGQKKSVYIYKFICKDTIEERIKQLQDRKLEIASNVLSGGNSAGAKLTLNDLKSLFAL